jgi:3D (Asp-Asp-Asp) domain-containing protein
MQMVLVAVLLGNLTITSYRSVPSQTDDSPYYTSIGEHVNSGGVAVSRDLLRRWGGPLDYGDFLYVEGVGFKRVNDCMAARHTQHVDIWVENLDQERAINVKHRRVWVVHLPGKEKRNGEHGPKVYQERNRGIQGG